LAASRRLLPEIADRHQRGVVLVRPVLHLVDVQRALRADADKADEDAVVGPDDPTGGGGGVLAINGVLKTLTAATAAAAVAAFLMKPRRVSTPAWEGTEFCCILVSQPKGHHCFDAA